MGLYVINMDEEGAVYMVFILLLLVLAVVLVLPSKARADYKLLRAGLNYSNAASLG